MVWGMGSVLTLTTQAYRLLCYTIREFIDDGMYVWHYTGRAIICGDTLFLVGFERVELTMALEKGKTRLYVLYCHRYPSYDRIFCTFKRNYFRWRRHLLHTAGLPALPYKRYNDNSLQPCGVLRYGRGWLCGLKSTCKDRDRRDIM